MSELDRAIEIVGRLRPSRIMIARCGSREFNRRHVALRCDADGQYIRYEKRGQNKRYLRDMAGARVVDDLAPIVIFYP